MNDLIVWRVCTQAWVMLKIPNLPAQKQ